MIILWKFYDFFYDFFLIFLWKIYDFSNCFLEGGVGRKKS